MIDQSADRRGFFRQIFGQAVEGVARRAEERWVHRHYVRPPGAIPEIGFLAACSRCGKCSEACPPHAIRIAGTEGGLATGTPYLEPDLAACIACAELPCIAQCPTGALEQRPESGWRGLRLGWVTFHPDRCITFRDQACGICANACPVGARALALDDNGRPVLKIEGCVGCGVCVTECPTTPSSLTFSPLGR